MTEQKYTTIRIRIANRENVRLEIHDSNHRLVGEPSGGLGLKNEALSRIMEIHGDARSGNLSAPDVEELGTLLFSALFDEGLRREFFNCYETARQDGSLLRLELDVDEHQLPDAAVLPWEFMYVPAGELHGALWPAAEPNMVFTRRRALWRAPEPVRLNVGERLRIALAVAAPDDLGPVQFGSIWNDLKERSRTERFEVLDMVNPADRRGIDAVLEKKPHIFHFIGHGRLKDKKTRESGQVALVDNFGRANWVPADTFSELFNRHRPGLVLLQACESGSLSSSNALVGAASRVVQMNIPAVAAMQFEVSNVTAQRFALEFYRRLADNEPVDKACQEARRVIALGPSGYGSRDFATPVLFMRVQEGRLFQRQTDIPDKDAVIKVLKEKAKKMEENTSFDEAGKTWKDIRDLNPGDHEIEAALNGLEKKIERQQSILEIKEKLSARRKELDRPFYMKIIEFLNRREREKISGEEIHMELIRDFLSNDLDARDFAGSWESDSDRPEPAPDYENLAERLMRHQIVPFLGSDVLRLSGLDAPSSRRIVKQMAEEVGYPDFDGTLPMISQYCQLKEGYTIEKLIETMKKLMKKVPGSQLNPLYNLIGEMPDPILVISTSYDDLLEGVLRQKERKFVVFTHEFQSTRESDFGKILLKYHDRDEPEEVGKDEDISKLKLLEKGYFIIYKICGYFSLEESQRVEQLMILENDFLAFSRRLEKIVPDHITRIFKGAGFLFMGYNPDGWYDRLIANALIAKCYTYVRSLAVREDPDPYECTFWKSSPNNVDVYRVELSEFVKNLNKYVKSRNNGK